ncbi:MAG: hypothetical protein PVH18_04545 [Chloroflexota bacterium]|jgi:hypothetical protein
MPLSHAITLAIDRTYTAPYINKILATSPIAYWPLNETSGTTINCLIDSNQDGEYTGVTLNSSTGPDGQPVGLWDGSNDEADVFTATLAGNFNGAVGTIAIWAKVSGSGVWTDAAIRAIGPRLLANSTNYVHIYKNSTDNQLVWIYDAAGTIESITKNPISPTDWFHLALTWNKGADEVKAYYNGSQQGSTQTGLNIFAGSLTEANVGSNNAPAVIWDGYLAHAAVWDSALTPAKIAALATV